MRLKQIKLAGFKSFVDPTKIPFPNPLTAIIGPNGCGKSNVIDAVRWVLGESSAKHLRGDSMTDVIFNGSTARRPVSVASVELIFDNREGRLGGQYASYEEIGVKRQVSRDGESLYFLNGQKCRRKDITDLFMGTGLGARSYAIIEQGMISRLIESKPQELRVFIEEAAGISRYKERRRDTENRIRHTRENLERLGDIRLELGRQLEKLAIQSEAARRYREYKQAERKTHAELMVMRYQDISQQQESLGRELAQQEQLHQTATLGLAATETRLEEHQLRLRGLSDAETELLEAYYQAGTEVARLEQQLAHLDIQYREQRQQAEAIAGELATLRGQLQTMLSAREQQRDELDAGQARLLELEETQDVWRISAQEAEDELQTLAGARLNAERQSGDAKRARDMATQRLTHLRHAMSERVRSLDTYAQQLQNLTIADGQSEGFTAPSFTSQEAMLERAREEERLAASNLDSLKARIASSLRQQSELDGRLAVLGSLLQAKEINELAVGASPLWQVLDVDAGWEEAVSVWLGWLLELAVLPADIQKGEGFCQMPRSRYGKLSAPVNLSPWFEPLAHQGAYVDTLDEALLARAGLGTNHIILVKTGELVGQGFMLKRQSCGEDKVVLAAEAERVKATLASLGDALRLLDGQRAQLEMQYEGAKASRLASEQALASAKLEASRAEARFEARQQDLRRSEQQQRVIEAEIARLQGQQQDAELELEAGEEALFSHDEALEDAGATLDEMNSRQSAARRLFEERRASLANIDNNLSSARGRMAKLNTELALLCQQLDSVNSQIGRLELKQDELNQKLNLQQTQGGEAQRLQFKQRLDEQIVLQAGRQDSMAENRAAQAGLQAQIDTLLLMQKQEVGKIALLTRTLESLRLRREGLKGQTETQLAQLAEAEIRLTEVLPGIPAHATVDEWASQLDKLKSKISRLGAINLAAIEEFDEAKSRKDYLDEQDTDLNQALESLEEAIRRIDRETRSRFKTTFEQVNADLGTLFPKVFGGGSAYLALTDDDLLETGVSIMARPPGKKNSTIHLLSGGEKALTALSLVFAIFRLNPAPFCMLDEVDAPLDDANVDRFCRLLQEMSASVQFVYISHNKITMEMADQLIGVTMHEPGVSRIVAVDIEEAVAMAQAE